MQPYPPAGDEWSFLGVPSAAASAGWPAAVSCTTKIGRSGWVEDTQLTQPVSAAPPCPMPLRLAAAAAPRQRSAAVRGVPGCGAPLVAGRGVPGCASSGGSSSTRSLRISVSPA